jgi:DNA repair exonuclease SbcCD ATPase subunit
METLDYREELENIKKDVRELKEGIQKLQELPDKIDAAVYQEEIIRDLHQELQQYKKGLIADISKGYVMSIINIYERLSDTCMHLGPSSKKLLILPQPRN